MMLPHLALRVAREQSINEIRLWKLPANTGRGRDREVHDGGPALVGYVADAMRYRRAKFCADNNIDAKDVVMVLTWDPAQRFASYGEFSMAMENARTQLLLEGRKNQQHEERREGRSWWRR